METKFTDREKEIADLLFKGCTYFEVARILKISPETLRRHRKAIFRKRRVKSRSHLLADEIERLTEKIVQLKGEQ